MTHDPRAALIVGAVYDSRIGSVVYCGLDHYHGETTHKFKPGDGRYVFYREGELDYFLKREALTASAPKGEPVGYMPQITVADIRKHTGDGMVSMDSVIDAVNALLKERCAPPTAGWDERDVDAATAAYNIVWQQTADIDASNVDEVRRDAMRAALEALRREAPAPSGVANDERRYGWDVIDRLSERKMSCHELAHYVWERSQNEPMCFEQDIARLFENERRNAANRARKDEAQKPSHPDTGADV